MRTGERFVSEDDTLARIPTVEVWIGGRRFIHDCTDDQTARETVVKVMIDLGLKE